MLAVLFAQRELRRSSAVATTLDEKETVEPGGEQPVRVHKGFVYSVTLGVEPNFRVAARETVEFASGWYELRDVEVSLYHRGEEAYGLVAEKARFNPTAQEATATGAAQLSLQGGVAVRAEGFSIHGPERMVESMGAVSFAGPGWGGVAGGMTAQLSNDTLDLVGGVSVSQRGAAGAEGAVVLLAPRVHFVRSQGAASFPEGLTVLRGPLRLRAKGAEIQVAEEKSELQRALLLAPVLADGTLADGEVVDASAGNTLIEAIGDGRYRLTAEPLPESGWVTANLRGEGGVWREMTAWRVVGEGTEKVWDWLEGQGLACVDELVPRQDPTWLSAERVRTIFADGQPAVARAINDVTIDSGDRHVHGGELTYSIGTHAFTLTPAEGERVQASGPEGSALCDRVEGDPSGAITARGNVSGIIANAGLLSSSREAVHFAARVASRSPDGTTLVLEGDARLWQGDRLVRADRLEWQPDDDHVRGSGNVVTMGAAQASGQTGTGGKGKGNIDIRARSLDYTHSTSIAVYEGDVVMTDERATSTCQRLVVNLSEKGEVLLATLEGGVQVEEKATTRTLRGQRARLVPPEGLFEIWGAPVVAQEPNGNQIKGKWLEWRQASNTVVVLGGEDSPSETIYHPERGVGVPQAAPGGTPGGATSNQRRAQRTPNG